jgi:predicted metal-dependent hydrolase|tara:strand:+ start:645 stop:1292 length:648 start_codon:yes stop_codon:yes gene_type:complete
MNLIEESYTRLYPNKEFTHLTEIKYSGKFKPFNANVRYSSNKITLNLSKKWRKIDKEITIGLVQELLIKIFKIKKHTKNMDMYNSFIKNLHKYTPKTESHPLLESSFQRVNDRHFSNILEQPNLKFGKKSFSKLGSYEYASDTITISKALEYDLELIDYVMYHELLHKKHQFKSKNGRALHHSTKFRQDEKLFPNHDLMEKRLSRLRLKNAFRIF